MKTLGYALVLHTMVIPLTIMIIGYVYWAKSMYIFLAIFVALLWIYILGKIYVTKIMKLKQEIDAEQK